MRGQFFSYDFILALFIFIVLFAALALAWDNTAGFSISDSRRAGMDRLASAIADRLVKTGGQPTAWESNLPSAGVIGLARSDRVLDMAKVETFMSMDYQAAKTLLKTAGYEFYFRLAGSGGVAGSYYTGGEVALARRVVMHNGNNETLELYIWRQE